MINLVNHMAVHINNLKKISIAINIITHYIYVNFHTQNENLCKFSVLFV